MSEDNRDQQGPSPVDIDATFGARIRERITPDAPVAGRPAGASPGELTRGAGYAGGYPTTDYADLNREPIHLTDYLRVLHKRRWSAAAVFLVVFGLTLVQTFTATPFYQARIQLLIDSQTPNVVNFEEVLQQAQRTNEYYQTQYRLLESRQLARRTLDAAQLWKHPVLTGERRPGGVSLNPVTWAGRGLAAVRALFSGQEEEAIDPSETVAQARIIDRFLAGLSITPVRNSQLVDVGFESFDPELAATAVNALGKAYIEQNLEHRFVAGREATEFLDRRMAEQRQALEQSELALQKYREQTDSVSLEDRQNIVVQRLEDLNAAVTRARTDRIQKQAVYEQVRAVQDDRAALDTVPAVLANDFIQRLKGELADMQRQYAQMSEKLAEKHPDMTKLQTAIRAADIKLQAEIAKVVQGLHNDYQAAVSQEQAMAAALNRQESEALRLNRQSIQYGALQRDATSNQQIFEGLLQRSKETGIASELRATSIRIVDEAEVPRRPSRPRKATNLMLGLFGGLLLGVGVAFFFEYVDDRIKAPHEIKAHLGLPFLGMVPAIDIGSLTAPPLVSNSAPRHFSEAFRTIRTNVLFASASAGSKSIVVTSTAPGEGKSLVSANLAMSLAMAGQRVVLIDADMRRPRVHTMLEVAQEPGLSNVLVGGCAVSEALRAAEASNLWVMAAGKHPPNPAELLGSVRFKDLLASLSRHFDWIILDSPPALVVTDASIISHVTTGALFVVGTEMTGRGAAKAALDQLDSAKAKYIGAILNKVDLKRNPYYYSQYYRAEYAQYYAQS